MDGVGRRRAPREERRRHERVDHGVHGRVTLVIAALDEDWFALAPCAARPTANNIITRAAAAARRRGRGGWRLRCWRRCWWSRVAALGRRRRGAASRRGRPCDPPRRRHRWRRVGRQRLDQRGEVRPQQRAHAVVGFPRDEAQALLVPRLDGIHPRGHRRGRRRGSGRGCFERLVADFAGARVVVVLTGACWADAHGSHSGHFFFTVWSGADRRREDVAAKSALAASPSHS